MSNLEIGANRNIPEVRISVTPGADDETMAVIATAVRHRLRVQRDDVDDSDHEEARRPSRWVMAGRREAMAEIEASASKLASVDDRLVEMRRFFIGTVQRCTWHRSSVTSLRLRSCAT